MKTIKCIRVKAGSVSIRYDRDWQEFRVVTKSTIRRLCGTYHTDDKHDARNTAALMVRNLRRAV